MNNRKTMIRFFTIADYEEEENWLRSQHRDGWKLVKTVLPCFYVFERCAPEDVAYRLDYKNGTENADYFQMFQDYGWEYCNRCMGWLYFRKPVPQTAAEQDAEIFSDDSSRLELVAHLLKTRLLPIAAIFLCCVLPSCIRSIERNDPLLTVLLTMVLLLDGFVVAYCGVKLRKLKKKYGGV